MSVKKPAILIVVERELDRIRKNKAYRFMLFAGPIIGIFLLLAIFKQGTVTDLPIAVIDQDDTNLSYKMTNAINSAPEVEIALKSKSISEAHQLMNQGKIEAIVIIPEGTQENVFRGSEASIPLYINGTNVLKSGLIQRSCLLTLRTISAGIQLKKLKLTGKSEQEAMNIIMPVHLVKHVLFNPYTNYNYFLNSAMLFVMLYLFVFLSSIYTLGNELKQSTGPDLLKHSNNNIIIAVIGKLIPYTIIFTAFSFLVDYLLYVVEGMPLNGSFGIIAAGQILTILVYQLLGVVFVAVTKNLRMALSLGSAYSMMAVTFSGLSFPVIGMPLVPMLYRAIFPFTWWEQIIISESLRGAGLKITLPFFYYILIFGLISLLCFRLYKRTLLNPKYWGRK